MARNEIPANIYKSDVGFLIDPETPQEEKAEFGESLARIIAGNYDYQSKNRYIRQMMAPICCRIQAERAKYAEISEKRSASGKSGAATRWQNMAKIANANEEIANANEEIANANEEIANANEEMANANEEMANANEEMANASRACARDINTYNQINNQINNNTPIPPKGENGGVWSFLFERFNFWRSKPDGRNLAWHSTDKNAMIVCNGIAQEQDEQKRADLKRQYFEGRKEHENALYCSWVDWCAYWAMMDSVCKLTKDQMQIFVAIFNHTPTPNVAKVLKEKAELLQTGYKVTDLTKFLQSALNRQI